MRWSDGLIMRPIECNWHILLIYMHLKSLPPSIYDKPPQRINLSILKYNFFAKNTPIFWNCQIVGRGTITYWQRRWIFTFQLLQQLVNHAISIKGIQANTNICGFMKKECRKMSWKKDTYFGFLQLACVSFLYFKSRFPKRCALFFLRIWIFHVPYNMATAVPV